MLEFSEISTLILASVFPRRNSLSDICPFPTSDSRTFFGMDRTIVLQFLVTVGHIQTAVGHTCMYHDIWLFILGIVLQCANK